MTLLLTLILVAVFVFTSYSVTNWLNFTFFVFAAEKISLGDLNSTQPTFYLLEIIKYIQTVYKINLIWPKKKIFGTAEN